MNLNCTVYFIVLPPPLFSYKTKSIRDRLGQRFDDDSRNCRNRLTCRINEAYLKGESKVNNLFIYNLFPSKFEVYCVRTTVRQCLFKVEM